jgi:hypothetical protein
VIWIKFFTVVAFIIAALAGLVKIILVAIDLKKRRTFRMQAYLLMAFLFTCSMTTFAIGHLFTLKYLVSTAFFMSSFWALGNIWIQFTDVSIPTIKDKIVICLITFIPFSPFVIFLARWSWFAPIGINFNTQLIWLNLIASIGIFLVWLVSFISSRLRTFYMYWSVVFFFFALAAFAARLDLLDTWTLASSILYLSGTLAYLYTWVNHGQNS